MVKSEKLLPTYTKHFDNLSNSFKFMSLTLFLKTNKKEKSDIYDKIIIFIVFQSRIGHVLNAVSTTELINFVTGDFKLLDLKEKLSNYNE